MKSVFLLSVTALSVYLLLLFGKTASWDVIHYHMYASFSVWNDRFGKDFFAAGPQSYVNPLPMALLYAMEWARVPVKAAACVLAALHSLNVWFALGIAGRLGLLPARQRSPWPLFFVTVLCFLSPIYLTLLGTTYSDIISSIPVLAGLWLAMGAFGETSRQAHPGWRWAGVGALMGLAAALKLSNAVFAVALVPPLLWYFRKQLWAVAGAFSLGALAGFLLGGGFWMYKLWSHFGNPLFPMFSTWLGDGGFGLVFAGMASRFIPQDWQAFLTLPFRIALPDRAIYIESPLPDARYAALFVLAAVGAVVWGLRRRAGHQVSIAEAPEHEAGARPGMSVVEGRALGFALTFFLLAWILWTLTSGNGRYMLPLALLASPLMVGLLLYMGGTGRLFVYPLLVMCAVQVMQLTWGSGLRLDTQAFWTRQWVEAKVPKPLQSEPYLYLSPFLQSMASMVPALHPDSGFINVGGQLPLTRRSISTPYVEAVFKRYQGRVKALVVETGEDADVSNHDRVDFALAPIGWRLKQPYQCVPITMNVLRESDTMLNLVSEVKSQMAEGKTSGVARATEATQSFRVLACDAEESLEAEQAYLRAVAPIDAALSRVEAACPKLFHPHNVPTQRIGKDMWIRFYGTADFNLVALNGLVQYIETVQGGKPATVGQVSDIAKGNFTIDCTKRREHVEVDYSMMPKRSPGWLF